jgi:hypothetical protein
MYPHLPLRVLVAADVKHMYSVGTDQDVSTRRMTDGAYRQEPKDEGKELTKVDPY